MSSIPNGLNSYYGDDTMNLQGSIPIQMNSSFGSMIHTSNITNHHGLFSASHGFNFYQDSHVSSSSFGFNNSHVAYHQMRTNMVSDVVDYFPVNINPHLSQVSITQTITRKYSAIVPTSSLITVQNGYMVTERAMNPNPSFYPQTFVDNPRDILNPTPLNSVFPRDVDLFSFSPTHYHDNQHVPHRPPVIKRSNPKRTFEEIFDDFDFEENGEYDGRTHSLPYEKYGPYTCPKCNNVFDTSQKFAAHVSSTHYKNETDDERAMRYKARNRKRFRKANETMHGESQEIQHEDIEERGGNDNMGLQVALRLPNTI